MFFRQFFKLMADSHASDLFFTAGSPVQIKIKGEVVPVDQNRLVPDKLKEIAYETMSEAQIAQFEQDLELNYSLVEPGIGSFRVNVFKQRGAIGIVIRHIKHGIPTVEQLGVPLGLKDLVMEKRGLILVVGATGSGKSSTLAAMINHRNMNASGHILTIEDPIEYIHQHKGCLVNQREVHADTLGFAAALRAALREDPDIVLIGEMRDLETIESGLRIAETGHLTFATLHTNSAAQTINRIIDVFPAHQQGQIRTQLSLVLEGIICQTLLPKADGTGRVVALEIMIPTPAIRNLIRDDKVHQIYSTMQTGQEKLGMQTMNQNLVTLYQKRLITLEAAMMASSQKDELEQMIARGAGVVAGAGLNRTGMAPRTGVR
jgi:twitching motility protein PilT